jgi:hypothetical protein
MSFDSNTISVCPYDFTIATHMWLSPSELIIAIYIMVSPNYEKKV